MRYKRLHKDAVELAVINQRHVEWLQKELNQLRDERLEWFILCRRFAYCGTSEWGNGEWGNVYSDYLRTRGRLEDPRG